MAKKIHIIVNPKTGQVEFEVEGVIGASCTDLTNALAKGHKVEAEQLTEDYFQASVNPAYIQDM